MLKNGDVYEFVLEQSFLGSQVISTAHMRLLADITTSVQSKFQAVADDFKTMMRAVQSQSLTYLSWKAQQVAGDGVVYDTSTCKMTGGDFYSGLFTGTLTGNVGPVTGDDLPATQCILVSLLTGLRGRRHHGRLFIGGMTEGQQAAGILASSTASALAGTITTHHAKYGSGGSDANFRWAVFSKVTASGCKRLPTIVSGRVKYINTHVATADAANSAPGITSEVVDTKVRSLHRRLLGVGS